MELTKDLWVSVSDDYPKDNEKCLVYVYGKLQRPSIKTAVYLKNGTFSFRNLSGTAKVHYWMPIPKPPIK